MTSLRVIFIAFFDSTFFYKKVIFFYLFKEIFKGYPEKKVNPLFRTTNSDYGGKRPNVHTMPTNYFPNTSGFTEHLGKCGMYRNQSLNCNTDKSKV